MGGWSMGIDELLEEKFKDITPTSAIIPNNEAQELYGRLEMWNKSCKDIIMDLKTINFTANDEDMFLSFQDRNYFDKDIYFKTDPNNPKDPKIQIAQKQFCSYLKIPHKFFMQNRPSLKMNIVKTWQTGLQADEKKGLCIVRIRDSKECSILRALVPETYSLIQNHEIIGTVIETVKEPYKLEYFEGDGRDDLVLHARFLVGSSFKIGVSDVCLGFAITASELGAGPLMVDSFLFDMLHKTSYIISYGTEPFFKTKYEGLQPKDFKELLPKMIDRIELEVGEIKERIEEQNKEIVPLDECLVIRGWKGLSTKFKKALYQEVAEKGGDIKSIWDFALRMGLIAKDFEINSRLAIERAAGKYLNLSFNKS